MPTAFRHNQHIAGGELQCLNIIFDNDVELSRARNNLYQLVSGGVALPAGVAVEAAKIKIRVLEIADAERAKRVENLVFRGVRPSVDDGLNVIRQFIDVKNVDHDFVFPMC